MSANGSILKRITDPKVHLPDMPRLTQPPLTEVAEAPEFTQEELLQKAPATELPQNPYVRVIGGVEVDIYRVLKAWGISDPGVQHAIKKLLRRGRADKSEAQDIEEAIQSLQRSLEIMEEDK
jgi:hypothetical protein